MNLNSTLTLNSTQYGCDIKAAQSCLPNNLQIFHEISIIEIAMSLQLPPWYAHGQDCAWPYLLPPWFLIVLASSIITVLAVVVFIYSAMLHKFRVNRRNLRNLQKVVETEHFFSSSITFSRNWCFFRKHYSSDIPGLSSYGVWNKSLKKQDVLFRSLSAEVMESVPKRRNSSVVGKLRVLVSHVNAAT